MLLTGYTKEIFKPECNPHFESVHCYTTLVSQGVKGADDCPPLDDPDKARLISYLKPFRFIEME
ncbi:MAG: hypothetical protein D3926_22150 [Desulfobacteraceae bacterium]|nr:MAG: hypothetical protein D3926_22150 [Desulfobacteraceae bacterium]